MTSRPFGVGIENFVMIQLAYVLEKTNCAKSYLFDIKPEILNDLKKKIQIFFFLFQLLQNLGKADRTTDEIFDEHLQNFSLQQTNANRLQKDISNYIRCIRGEQTCHFFSEVLKKCFGKIWQNLIKIWALIQAPCSVNSTRYQSQAPK